MAVWQFVIDFVPEQFLLNEYGHIPETMLPEHQSQDNFFQKLSFKEEDIEACLHPFGIAETHSWSSTFHRYLSEADNDFSIYFDKRTDIITALSCRVDVRQPIESFIYGIVTLAASHDFRLMARGTRQIFEPTVSQLLQAMQQSNAFRFVNDPLKFLDGFSKGNPNGY